MVNKDFYPTPAALLDAVTAGVRWEALGTVLEPEAGMGDIVEYVMKRYRMRTDCELDVDCVELDPALQKILRQKGYRLVHDDFLTYQTHKQYDLIIMNPPFSNGAAHLTKALQMQEDGGNIICILNAETIRNPWTNERKALVTRLGQLNAQISYMEGGFVHADRPTDVEIAVVKVSVPKIVRFQTKKEFDKFRWKTAAEAYLIWQKKQYLKLPSAEKRPTADVRYDMRQYHFHRYNTEEYLDRAVLRDMSTNGETVEFSIPWKKDLRIDDVIDKSGYIILFHQEDLKKKANMLRAERSKSGRCPEERRCYEKQ